MAAQSTLALLGVRSATLGSSSSLAVAFALSEGSVDPAAHTSSSRIGWYADRTGGSEKIGVVVMGAEVMSIGVNGLSTANPFTASNLKSGTGSPNGSVTGNPGDTYQNTTGGAATTFWVKETGSGTNTGWVAYGASGSGTVTSVALALPAAVFAVSGSPVTGSGTLTGTFQTQNANLVFAGPNTGSAATPTFRSLVTADLPLSGVTATSYGSASSVATFTVDATGRITTAATTSISITASQVSNFDNQVHTSRLDQMAAPTSSVSWNSQKITALADPTSAQDAATKNYVDSVAQGLSVKNSVLVASTANLTLSGEQTIDGFLTSSSRVLVKNQSTASQNGIYVTGSGAWTRSSDMSLGNQFAGAFVFVEEGTANGSTGWVCTNIGNVTVGTTSITFSQFSGAGTYVAGTGLTLTGNTFSITAGGVGPTQLATTTVSAGGYGSASSVATFTVDSNGRLTAAASTAISVAASAITSGQLSTARGGTGLDTSAAANGTLLIGNGSGLSAATLTQGGGVTVTNGSGTITLGFNASNVTTGILPVAQGGTGLSGATAANGTMLIGNGSGYTLTTLTAGNGILITNASGAVTIGINEQSSALSSGANTVDSVAVASFGTVTWDVTLVKSTARYATTVRATHDGTNPFYGEFGTFVTGGTLDAPITVTLSGGNLNLVVTPGTSGWAIRYQRRTMAV